MYYHASKIGNLAVLKPFVSNHKKEYIYFSDKRENVLIYCSNPIEKYCKENKIDFGEKYTWFAPYGFDRNGTFCYEEYCPNLLYESYYGACGYIYIITAGENSDTAKDCTLECFRGFARCLEGSIEKGVIFAKGVYEKGEVKGTRYMKEAYEMGKSIN